MKINKEYLKQQYLKENQIDLTTVKTDLKKIKKVIKSNVFTCYPNRYQLFKNKKTGRLYLTVCTINFDIVILGYSDKKILNDQMIELFPEYIFFEKGTASGFDLFPGNKSTIYGFSDESNIILGPTVEILEF